MNIIVFFKCKNKTSEQLLKELAKKNVFVVRYNTSDNFHVMLTIRHRHIHIVSDMFELIKIKISKFQTKKNALKCAKLYWKGEIDFNMVKSDWHILRNDLINN